jgi:hypothetical protein
VVTQIEKGVISVDMDAFMAFVGKFAGDLGAVVAGGNTSREVGAAMFVSPRTVERWRCTSRAACSSWAAVPAPRLSAS